LIKGKQFHFSTPKIDIFPQYIDKKNEKCEDRSINDLNSLANHFKTHGNPDIIDTAFEEHISTDLHNREQK
jgi:hypothetical protein